MPGDSNLLSFFGVGDTCVCHGTLSGSALQPEARYKHAAHKGNRMGTVHPVMRDARNDRDDAFILWMDELLHHGKPLLVGSYRVSEWWCRISSIHSRWHGSMSHVNALDP